MTNLKAPASCDDLVAYVDGELPPGRAGDYREHLKGCDRCRERVVEELQLSAQLASLPGLPSRPGPLLWVIAVYLLLAAVVAFALLEALW